MNKRNKLYKAFTMIELLVVISIIGILATMATVSFTASQKQARDTNRKSDIKQYQTTLEQYANKNSGLYVIQPTTLAITDPAASFCVTDLELDACSVDPKNEDPYTYKYISDAAGTNYVLWAKLENADVDTWWVSCSNGRNGESATVPNSSICPANLQ